MRIRVVVTVVAAAPLFAACGGEGPSADRVGADPTQDGSSISLHTKFVRSGPLFTEGALVEVTAVTDTGRTVVRPQRFQLDSTHELGPLDSGTYQLRVAVRPCDGNCGWLDATAFECQSEITAPTPDDVTVTVDGRHCEITTAAA